MRSPSYLLLCLVLIAAFFVAPSHVMGDYQNPEFVGSEVAEATNGTGSDCHTNAESGVCPDCIGCIAGVSARTDSEPLIIGHSPNHHGFPAKPAHPSPDLQPPKRVFFL